MRVVLVVLCCGAVGFLLRVLVAFVLEWGKWPSREKSDEERRSPRKTYRSVLVLESEPPPGFAGRIGVRT